MAELLAIRVVQMFGCAVVGKLYMQVSCGGLVTGLLSVLFCYLSTVCSLTHFCICIWRPRQEITRKWSEEEEEEGFYN